MADTDRLLNAFEVARRVGAHHITVRRWVKLGRFPAPIRAQSRVYWLEADVATWLKRGNKS